MRVKAARASMIDRISAYRDAGANYYVLGLGRYPDADTFRRGVERFATQVMPKDIRAVSSQLSTEKEACPFLAMREGLE